MRQKKRSCGSLETRQSNRANKDQEMPDKMNEEEDPPSSASCHHGTL